MGFVHKSVLAAEVLRLLDPRPGGVYLDGTLGGGGHASVMLDASGPSGRLIGLDRDEDAVRAAAETLAPYGDRVTIVREDFRNMRAVLDGLGVERVDGVLLDLGVSSHQLEAPERGFSFSRDAALDMRMDRRQGLTARDIVNGSSAGELTRIFREYGEEREAPRIARAIERARQKRPVETTGELAAIVSGAVPKRLQPRSIHPATRVFQALRIAVNDELGGLAAGLAAGFGSLKSGGRMAVISFHSLEDRMVKAAFREYSTGCVCPPRIPRCVCGRTPAARLLTKRAVTPSGEEIRDNPRARSAKLRAVERL